MELHIPPSRLERHVRLLLRAYPPAYRADRGEEMLGTLLEATPEDRDWPSARDTRSLLAGGVRARAAYNARLAPAVGLRQAAQLGLSLYVVQQVYLHLFTLGSNAQIRGGTAAMLVACGLLTATVIAAWLGRRPLAAITAVLACAALAYYAALFDHHYNVFYATIVAYSPARLGVPSVIAAFYLQQLPLALSALVLALLARRDARLHRTWLWLPALLLAEMAACWLGGSNYPFAQAIISPGTPVTSLMYGTSLLFIMPSLIWLVTDTRPALGLVAFLAALELSPTIQGIEAFLTAGSPSLLRQVRAENAIILVLMLALAAGLARLLRRRTQRRGEATS